MPSIHQTFSGIYLLNISSAPTSDVDSCKETNMADGSGVNAVCVLLSRPSVTVVKWRRAGPLQWERSMKNPSNRLWETSRGQEGLMRTCGRAGARLSDGLAGGGYCASSQINAPIMRAVKCPSQVRRRLNIVVTDRPTSLCGVLEQAVGGVAIHLVFLHRWH